MASYSVLTKDAPADLALVREGFTFFAFLLGPIWFAWKRAWLGAAVTIAGILSITALFVAVGAAPGALAAAIIAFMLLMGLEAPEFIRRALVRRGYQVADVVVCNNWNEAEVRFLARRLSAQQSGDALNRHSRVPSHRAETVGLFFNGS
jgi:hypothetical protein